MARISWLVQAVPLELTSSVPVTLYQVHAFQLLQVLVYRPHRPVQALGEARGIAVPILTQKAKVYKVDRV